MCSLKLKANTFTETSNRNGAFPATGRGLPHPPPPPFTRRYPTGRMGVPLSFCSLCFHQLGFACSCITQWAVIYTSHYLFLCSNHPRLGSGTPFELAQSPSDTCPSARYSRSRIISLRNPCSFQCREIFANQGLGSGVVTVVRCRCHQALSVEPGNSHTLTHTPTSL